MFNIDIDRPVFSQLLIDIEQELYDAVVVMDIDRLGRGDDKDWGRIEDTFRDAEVFIITPEKIYDWKNEADEFLFTPPQNVSKLTVLPVQLLMDIMSISS